MRALVVDGTKRGGTVGLAEAVADGIREGGHEADVRPAAEIDGLAGWDAVIVGGALYAWRWQRDARRFVRHHTPQLKQLPVWFFSSGPLDESADEREIPPVGAVGRMMNRIGARAHRTFGGRMVDEGQNQLPHGDWRNLSGAVDWGRQIAETLDAVQPRTEPLPDLESRRVGNIRRIAEGLCLFTGVTAVVGGVSLVVSPQGAFGMTAAMLAGTPFSSFFLPGLLLLLLVGVPNLVSSLRLLRRRPSSDIVAVGAGGVLTIWIVVQMVMLQSIQWLQLLYLGVGLATMATAFGAWWLARTGGRRLVTSEKPS